ncbi:MAG: peptidoglycan DD-metalloendopeptidase family protein [Paludibacteraceae bacterium]|nr:peptidoglycan DD-metalloendopeptidase family protein [Paludibacteraceae bacterium]
MQKNLWLIFLIVILGACTSSGNHTKHEQSTEPTVRYDYNHIAIDSFRIDTFQVQRNETLGAIFLRLGATSQQMAELTQKQKDYREFYTIHQGKTYLAFYQDSTLCYYIYLPTVKDAYIIHLGDTLGFERFEKPITTSTRQADITIHSSLWNAIVDDGLPPTLSLSLYDVYAWSIDFFGLQQGDRVLAYYDEQYVDSTFIGIGRIHAANFHHRGKWFEAYYYEDEHFHSYYDEKGNSLKKSFLKAPLNYRRISSHFSYARKHPIFKVYRPHLGVDYAAPAGTPVVSIGDGVVIEKKYDRGGGYMLKIKHNSAYTTGYLHLQGYAKGIHVGTHVTQGQLIGYVGSTGHSTGPHLDFRVWMGGKPINPLKVDALPVEPIPDSLKTQFNAVVEQLRPFITPQTPDELESVEYPFNVYWWNEL